MLVLGGAPKRVLQPQKIFVSRQQLRVDLEADDRARKSMRNGADCLERPPL